jgi:hypothetical protein
VASNAGGKDGRLHDCSGDGRPHGAGTGDIETQLGQSWLESFGREVALKYKFNPLVIDGTPRQMVIPLVLHFTTTLGADPLPQGMR